MLLASYATVQIHRTTTAAETAFQPYARLAKTLPDELRRARQEHLPLTVDDLRPHPPVAPQDNAAPLYRRAVAMYHAIPEKERDRISSAAFAELHGTTAAGDRAIIATALVQHADLIHLSEQASRKPACDFDRLWATDGPNVLLSEYSTLRQIAALFAARATTESDACDPTGALRDLATVERIGAHAGSDPILVATLVRYGIEGMTRRPFAEVIRRYGGQPDVLSQIDSTERSLPPLPDLKDAICGAEVVTGRQIAEGIRHPSPRTTPWVDQVGLRFLRTFVPPRWRNSVADAEESRFLAMYSDLHHALAAAHGDLRRQQEAILALQAAQSARMTKAAPGYELCAALRLDLADIPKRAATIAAERATRSAAIAAIRHGGRRT